MDTQNNETDIAKLTIDRTSVDQPKSLFSNVSLVFLVGIILLVSVYWFTQKSQAQDSQLMTKKIDEATFKTKPISSQTTEPKNTTSIASKINNASDTSSILDASGHIVARRIATVSSRVTGKLERLHIEEGQHVSKSQVLAELDDQQAQISYQLALAELAAKQATYDELEILQQFEIQRFNRRQQLAKDNLISLQLSEDSQQRTEQIAVQLRNKKALVELAKQRVELALYQLKHHKIRAPFDGVVISKNAQVGELISTGSSAGGSIRTGVGTIVDMDSLEIEVEVGESYINRVYSGQAVSATLDAYPQWQIKSEVITVIPTADRQRASIKVRIKLLETDQRIFPDMGVKVSFIKA